MNPIAQTKSKKSLKILNFKNFQLTNLVWYNEKLLLICLPNVDAFFSSFSLFAK